MDGYIGSTYGDAFADVYDDWYKGISDVGATVTLLAELAAEFAPLPVLELGVGTGRLAIPLAAGGFTVVGLDASAAMLAKLTDKDPTGSVTTCLGDMVEDQPAGPFALVFVAYNTFFNLLTEDRQRACLAAVADRLAPGAALLIEAFVPEPQAGSSVVVRSMTAESVVLSITTHHEDTQTAEGQFISFSEAEGVRMRPWAIRYSTVEQLDAMASASGFRMAERWEDAVPRAVHRRQSTSRHGVSHNSQPPSVLKHAQRPKLTCAVSQLRLNPLTGRWVTIVAERAERPTDFAPRVAQVEADPDRPCPFCPGNEEVLPALETVDKGGTWRMRVIPNLYPAFDGDEPFAVHHRGPVHVEAEASGTHEVFVLTREHNAGIHDISDADAAEMMLVLKRRFLEHAATPNVRYTQAIINHGREAGTSIAHPHGQLLGLPFVPGELLEEQRAFSRFEGGCILCATIEAELGEGERVLFTNDDVVCVCPYWSGTPYELLLIPRNHELHLTDASDVTLASVGRSMHRTAIEVLRNTHGDISYNIGFHTAPHHYNGAFHWHVHLWPKLVTTAGFERGTGVMLNIVSPEVAAKQLRRQVVKA